MIEPDAFRGDKPVGYGDGHDAACDGPPLCEHPCSICKTHLKKVAPPPTILEEAAQLTDGARQKDYGPPDENLDRIAAIWSVVLGTPVTRRQVALCMVGVKIARDVNAPKRDNLVDAAGYLRIIEMADG